MNSEHVCIIPRNKTKIQQYSITIRSCHIIIIIVVIIYDCVINCELLCVRRILLHQFRSYPFDNLLVLSTCQPIYIQQRKIFIKVLLNFVCQLIDRLVNRSCRQYFNKSSKHHSKRDGIPHAIKYICTRKYRRDRNSFSQPASQPMIHNSK